LNYKKSTSETLHALIDVGSNSIRLSIYKYDSGEVTHLINRKEMAGLAGYVREGALSERGVEKLIVVLTEFQEVLKNFHIENVHVFATASLRNISNTEYVVAKVKDKTGIDVEIISGNEEARLDFVGLKFFSKVQEGVLTDIGGGSTEIVVFNKLGISQMVSIPLGSLNLYVKNVEEIIPEKAELKAMKKAIKRALDEVMWDEFDPVTILQAIGGTARGVFRICRELFYDNMQVNIIQAKDIRKLARILEKSDTAKLKEIFRIVPERVFTIIPGVLILNEVIKRFGTVNIQLSTSGLREGYLVDKVLGSPKNVPNGVGK